MLQVAAMFDGAVVIPAVAPSATLSSVLTCAAVSSSALLVPLDTLPKILLLVTEIELGEILLLPNLAVGIVPVVNALAFKSVRDPPPTAGNVVGNLQFGIVPDPRLSALSYVSDTHDT